MLELVTVGEGQRKSMRNVKETEGNELLRKVEVECVQHSMYIHAHDFYNQAVFKPISVREGGGHRMPSPPP